LKGWHIGLLFVALLLAAGFSGCQLPGARVTPLSEAQPGPAAVLADGTPYRAGPGGQYDILGKLGRGELVYILSRQGEWYQVRLASGEQAWMHNLVIQPIGDTATPAPSATHTSLLVSSAASPTATASATITPRPTRTPWPTLPPASPSNTPIPKPPTATRVVRVATPTPTAGAPTLMLRRIIVTGEMDALRINWRYRWDAVGAECFDANGQKVSQLNLLRADGWYPVPVSTTRIKLWIGAELGGTEWWRRWDSQAADAAPIDVILVIARAGPR
jgi:SH3-like domain-containing protein